MTEIEIEQMLGRINSLYDELKSLSVKQQTFSEMISHLRSRFDRVETRKREIHYEIQDIKAQAKVWGKD